MRHVLAGEPAREDIHGCHVRPVNLRDVAKVGDVRPVVREDARCGWVYLTVPDDLTADGGLNTKFETPLIA